MENLHAVVLRLGLAALRERGALHAKADQLVSGSVGEIDSLLECEPAKRAPSHQVEGPIIQLEEVTGSWSGAAGPELPAVAQAPFPRAATPFSKTAMYRPTCFMTSVGESWPP